MLLALHEQEKIAWMKKIEQLQRRERKEDLQRLQIKLKLKEDQEDHRTKINEFQKNYAIEKAAEVI